MKTVEMTPNSLRRSTVFTSICLSVAVTFGRVSDVGADVPNVSPVVHARYPHDPQAFTQGLLFVGERLYESTGLYGSSTLRLVDLTTGVVQKSVSLSPSEFGEGLASVDQHLVQLTWKSGLAHVYDLGSFQRQRTFDYSGEGWGLCFDGKRLVMSDGSSSLFFRDPTTFAMTGSVAVSRDGANVRRLNELECVNGWVYANVWQTQEIVKIDPNSGSVHATVTVGGLLTAGEAANADVLNGIAYSPLNGRFYITGKLWPKLFEVEFLDAAAPTPPPSAPAEVERPTNGEIVPGVEPPGSTPHPMTNSAVSPSAVPPTMEGPVSSGAPPKVNSGCHCATAGAGATLGASHHWGMGAVALGLPLLRRRRPRRRSNA